MAEKRKGKNVSFSAEVKAEGGLKHGKKRVGKVVTFSAPNVKAFSSVKTIDSAIQRKLDNITDNTANMINQHAQALNAIAFWIAENDPKVKADGNVTQWAFNLQQERERLEERKAELEEDKLARKLGDADKKK